MGFPGGSAGKESTCKVGDLGSIPGLGRSPGEGEGYPFQYSGLENSMEEVPGVAKSRTQLSNFHFTSLMGIYRVSIILAEGRSEVWVHYFFNLMGGGNELTLSTWPSASKAKEVPFIWDRVTDCGRG